VLACLSQQREKDGAPTLLPSQCSIITHEWQAQSPARAARASTCALPRPVTHCRCPYVIVTGGALPPHLAVPAMTMMMAYTANHVHTCGCEWGAAYEEGVTSLACRSPFNVGCHSLATSGGQQAYTYTHSGHALDCTSTARHTCVQNGHRVASIRVLSLTATERGGPCLTLLAPHMCTRVLALQSQQRERRRSPHTFPGARKHHLQ
jgi:hypothetical protein